MHPVFMCARCGQHDDHPHHGYIFADGTTADFHLDCPHNPDGSTLLEALDVSAAGCAGCAATVAASDHAKGDALRAHINGGA